MAWTQADVDTLKSHIVTGVTKVDYGDRAVTYGSVADMMKALALIEGQVIGATVGADGRTGPQRVSYATFSRR